MGPLELIYVGNLRAEAGLALEQGGGDVGPRKHEPL